MSKKETIMVVSRALALYLACWTFSEVTYVPSSLYSLSHHLSQRSVLAAGDYFTDYDVLTVALRVFRIVALSIIALWLYKCGTYAQGYFLPTANSEDDAVRAESASNPPAPTE
jgi:hypothetical protein